MHWLSLFLAIFAEILSTSFLKSTNNFTRLVPSILVIIGYAFSFYCLTFTLRVVPVGIAYALWSGIGIVCVALISFLIYGQKLDIYAMIGIVFILIGVVIINMFSKNI